MNNKMHGLVQIRSNRKYLSLKKGDPVFCSSLSQPFLKTQENLTFTTLLYKLVTIFLFFPSKQYLTFHAICLHWRQLA